MRRVFFFHRKIWQRCSDGVHFQHVRYISLFADDESIQRINFQVYGKVTGVFFRKYTKLEAKKLDLTGWVRNVREGEVQGSIEGTPEKLEVMIHWLRHQGSPKSKIERVVFAEPVEVKGEVKPFHSFEVIK